MTLARRSMTYPVVAGLLTLAVSVLTGALTVPNEIQQPGTQPREVSNLETPDKCDNCHGGYNRAVEPSFNWRGSMMGNAGRDPIFWATLAVAEQDFDGAGDLCIRCHSVAGWLGGRSTPTDGSALAAGDSDGVECDGCHKMTDPNNSDPYLRGRMVAPFIANDEKTPATGYYGSGMLSVWGGNEKLGPYSDADARHQFRQSTFHRDVDYCGQCHDVSNPAVGDLAHNNGKQATGDPVVASGMPASPVSGKAAFNNFPFQYGIVERTFSEYSAGLLSKTTVSNYSNLPADLRAGAIKAAFDSAGGNYKDGSPRYFSCQTCHMRAVTGYGANKAGIPLRTDLPLHDMTGGNYWAADAILYQNTAATLRLGGGLNAVQIDAIKAGKLRAQQQLNLAASLLVSGNTLKVTNLTGHKLISGYPEGRRMWINVKWYDASKNVIAENGAYGELPVTIDGTAVKVKTIIDPGSTRVYEAHHGMTQEWADKLLTIGKSADLPLSYDRVNGAVNYTLGQLAAQGAGTYHETFHFVLNNTVTKDNRIPPYGMSYEEARKRNALPVPATQYGSPGEGKAYNYWDELTLNPPTGATYATISLMYQPTSWEYVQFLYLANKGTNAFLKDEGINLLNAWLNTGMAEPYVMATAAWGTPPAPTCPTPGVPQSLKGAAAKKAVTLTWTAASPTPTHGYRIYYAQAGKLQFRAGVGATVLTYKDTGLTSRVTYTYVVTSWNDCNGNGVFDAGIDTESAVSNTASATAG